MFLNNWKVKQKNWPIFHSLVVLCSFLAYLFGLNLLWIWVAAGLSFSVGIWAHRNELIHLTWKIGYPNLITLFRFHLLLFIAFSTSETILLFAILTFLLLDGLDGYVARRYNSTTRIGAYLDMETDAVYVLMMSIMLANFYQLHWIIIIVGLLRYLYEVLTWVFGVQDQIPPRTRIGPYAAVFLFLCLTTPLFLETSISKYLVYTGGIVVSGSFIYSGWFQFKKVKF